MSQSSPLWFRLNGETEKAYTAFELYRRMAAGERSIFAVAERFGAAISPRQRQRREAPRHFRVWARQHCWVARARIFELDLLNHAVEMMCILARGQRQAMPAERQAMPAIGCDRRASQAPGHATLKTRGWPFCSTGPCHQMRRFPGACPARSSESDRRKPLLNRCLRNFTMPNKSIFPACFRPVLGLGVCALELCGCGIAGENGANPPNPPSVVPQK